MKHTKSSKSLSMLAAGGLMLGAFSGLSANTTTGNALGYTPLGNGVEIREVIMNANSGSKAPAELKCTADTEFFAALFKQISSKNISTARTITEISDFLGGQETNKIIEIGQAFLNNLHEQGLLFGTLKQEN